MAAIGNALAERPAARRVRHEGVPQGPPAGHRHGDVQRRSAQRSRLLADPVTTRSRAPGTVQRRGVGGHAADRQPGADRLVRDGRHPDRARRPGRAGHAATARRTCGPCAAVARSRSTGRRSRVRPATSSIAGRRLTDPFEPHRPAHRRPAGGAPRAVPRHDRARPAPRSGTRSRASRPSRPKGPSCRRRSRPRPALTDGSVAIRVDAGQVHRAGSPGRGDRSSARSTWRCCSAAAGPGGRDVGAELAEAFRIVHRELGMRGRAGARHPRRLARRVPR